MESLRVAEASAPLFSCASGTIFSIRRAYSARRGAAVTPCKSTLRSTVSATTCSIRLRPASAGASATTISPNTSEASPRGPNQPINSIETPLSLVPISETATGSMRINVKLSTAYRTTRKLKCWITPNARTPKTKNTLRLSSCPSASEQLSFRLGESDGSFPNALYGRSDHQATDEGGDESIAPYGVGQCPADKRQWQQ